MYSCFLPLGIFLLTAWGHFDEIPRAHSSIGKDTISQFSNGGYLSGKKHSGEKIAITFDDGPNTLYTPQILQILKENSVPATFFVLGNRITGNENILIQIKKEGHEIGNHSYIHPRFSQIHTIRYVFEVWRTAGMIWSVTGEYPRYFRFPYGIEDQRIGYFHSGPIIAWNVDAYDWRIRSSRGIAKSIISQTKSGSIILLHDIKKDTIGALPIILETLKNDGYVFTSLEDLIRWSGTKNYRNMMYYSATSSRKVHSQDTSHSGTQSHDFSSDFWKKWSESGGEILTPREKIWLETILE